MTTKVDTNPKVSTGNVISSSERETIDSHNVRRTSAARTHSPELNTEDELKNLSVYPDDDSNSNETPKRVIKVNESGHPPNQKSNAHTGGNNKIQKERDFETLEERRNRLTYHFQNSESATRHREVNHKMKTPSKVPKYRESNRNKIERLQEKTSRREREAANRQPRETPQKQTKSQRSRHDSRSTPHEDQNEKSNRNTTKNYHDRDQYAHSDKTETNKLSKRQHKDNGARGQISKELHDKSDRQSSYRWIVKMTQRTCNTDDIILNRRSVMSIFNSIEKLHDVHSADIKIVEPWHNRSGSATLLHLNTRTVHNKILKYKHDIHRRGFYIEDSSDYQVHESQNAPSNRRQSSTRTRRDKSVHKEPLHKNVKTNHQKNHSSKKAADLALPNHKASYDEEKREYRTPPYKQVSSKARERSQEAKEQRSDNTLRLTKKANTQVMELTQSTLNKKEAPSSSKSGLWAWLPKVLNTHRMK
ncbi:peptidyl-prolyl cis-trans isomerase G-like [Ambystoma mexicanum]|uniref:peptidyl-prolyl cis-trans isomerase G-like n=1 Tax=Ambystoma mexicanum TaxID=8296 RepID=UPI0037E7330E